ncbi:MAG: hypothetical protein M1812_006727 [Candelaria pacifica]|nr:MAG: hypothetical protein M1812_006727 [Candelaria pacifica]
MPGIELAGLVGPEVSYDLPLLKAHKALPRSRDNVSTVYTSPSTHKPRVRSIHDKYASSSLGHTANLTPPPSRSDADLPLTPPSNHRLANGRTRLKISPAGTGMKDSPPYDLHQSSLSTSLNQSPPTPETTPPKPLVKPVALHARPTQRYPSSRAESFKTARENQSSSDDDSSRRQAQPSQTATQKWLDATRSARLKDIGLGLGLESEDEEITPTIQTPIKAGNDSNFVAFDGALDGAHVVQGPKEDIREWDDYLMRNVTVRKRSHKRPRVATQTSRDHQRLPETQDSTLELSRGPSLRERIEKRRHSPTSASTEKFGQEIEWPSMLDNPVLDVGSGDADLKRLSGVSGTSTIVEAMVVDTTPQRRQTLRHTGKNLAFRTRTLMYDPPDGRSVSSDGHQHRLVHRNPRVPVRSYSGRVASDASASIRSITSRERQENIPVMVIPETRSSLKSSAASSKQHSRSQSLTSAHQQSRPTTAPNGGAGYFDLPLRRRRPLSISSSVAAESGGRARDYQPIIPQRSSSLSAPTSRNASRSTSLTSASLKSRKAPKRNVVAIHKRAVSQLTSPDRANPSTEPTTASGWSFLKPPASQITPFSQPSITSSSPEAHEVSEATAVTIFPHNNESLLVVQQRARPILEIPRHLLASSEQISDLEEPLTPPTIGYPGLFVESPLKNPRKPPEPPMFKIIPPTPANNMPTNDADRPSTAVKTRPGGGALSLVKRALSTRRYSESFISPFSRLPGLKAAKNQIPNVTTEKDSKLHPFWRPRGFWDDFSDSDSDEDFGNEGLLLDEDQQRPSTASTFSRRMSLSLPLRSQSQDRRVQHNESESDSDFGNDGFLITRALTTRRAPKSNPRPRPTSTKETPQRRFSFPLRLHTQDHSLQRKQSSGSIRVEKPPRTKNKAHGFPSVQVEFIGLGGFKERLRLKKERKESERREVERTRLRKSIGARIVVPDARVT